jgi:hypothetical protein
MNKLEDFSFDDLVVDKNDGTQMVVVSIQPNNGDGAIVCFEKDELHPIVCSPEELTIVRENKHLNN